MKIHPRALIVNKVSSEVSDAIFAVIKKYDLTYIEMIGILHGEIGSMLKYALRAERHPENPDKPANVE